MTSLFELDHAPAPGETLRRKLEMQGMSQRELAVRTGLTPKHINQVLHGVVTLTPEVAQRLELATGVPARLWNRLEADFRTVQARQDQARDLSADADWVNQMPVPELVRRGMLPAEPFDVASRARQLLAFFGVASPAAWRDLWLRPNAAFRQSNAFRADPGATAAWLREGEIKAHAQHCEPFDAEGLRTVLPRLRSLSRQNAAVYGQQIRDLLADVGVATVYLPEVPGARVNGATIWLSPVKAAILLSLRHRKDDIFFFTLFHEIGHLLLHGRKETFISDPGSSDLREQEADQFAGDQLIPKNRREELLGLTTLAQAEEFASDIGVSAGIVAGQLHHAGAWNWSKGARLKRSLQFVETD